MYHGRATGRIEKLIVVKAMRVLFEGVKITEYFKSEICPVDRFVFAFFSFSMLPLIVLFSFKQVPLCGLCEIKAAQTPWAIVSLTFRTRTASSTR